MAKRLRDMSGDELRAWWAGSARKLAREALERFYVERQLRVVARARRRSRPCRDLRQDVDRLAVEHLLSESTILRVTLDFIQERGDEMGSALHDEYVKYLERRTR